MKAVLITCIAAFSLLSSASAQDNPFVKTAWKIETINEDGSAVLKKTKLLKLPTEQAKFHYIQFDDSKKYNTGTTCFHMRGSYNVYEDHQVEFSTMDAAATSDCPEPKNFSGTYSFEINKDQMTLRPLETPASSNEEDPGEAVEISEVKEAGK